MMNMLFLAYPFEFNSKKTTKKWPNREEKKGGRTHTHHPDTDEAEMYRAKKAHQPC